MAFHKSNREQLGEKRYTLLFQFIFNETEEKTKNLTFKQETVVEKMPLFVTTTAVRQGGAMGDVQKIPASAPLGSISPTFYQQLLCA